MDICRNLLELHQVYGVLTQSETQKLLESLEESKLDLMEIKTITLERMFTDFNSKLIGEGIDEGIDILSSIKEQIEYIEHNIIVVENALMCWETKIFEKRTFMGMKFNVGLN
jgi:hypothetical protein